MEAKQAFLIIAAILHAVLVITTLALFAYRGYRHQFVAQHTVVLTVVGAIAAFACNELALFQLAFQATFPCFLLLWVNYIGVTVWIGCLLARAIRLYLLYHTSLSRMARHKTLRDIYLEPMPYTAPNGPIAAQLPPQPSSDVALAVTPASPRSSSPTVTLEAKAPIQTVPQASQWFLRYQHRFTDKQMLLGVGTLALIMMVIMAVIQGQTPNVTLTPMAVNCTMVTWEYIPLIVLVAVLALLVAPVIVYHIWRIEDAWWLRLDLLVAIVSVLLFFTMYVVEAMGVWQKQYHGYWAPYGWLFAALFLSHCISVAGPLIKVRKAQVPSTHGHLLTRDTFTAVLDTPMLFEMFKLYSASNFCAEMTLFLEEYNNLKRRVFTFYNPHANFDDIAFNIIESPVHELPLQAPYLYTALAATQNRDPHGRGGGDVFQPLDAARASSLDPHRGSLQMGKDSLPYPRSTLASVRIPILQALYQSPAATTVNATELQCLPISLHMAYYGFYETFIAPGSSLQANIIGKIADGITKRVNARDYSVDMFDDALQEVHNLLYTNIFSKFVRNFSNEIQDHLA
ncbi:hypothetical protein H4R35_006442 [Dimargaris xerosporica]|nr:hypothetical protein H4R35_006442 [Dimargaris xerosporica]